MFIIDQRRCGAGKTTNGIYKRIANNIKNNIKTLVVVPSIKLQEQYVIDLDYPITIINSNLYNENSVDFVTTIQATLHHMKLGTNIIIITHQSFVKLPKTSHKTKYDLIIDEALDDVIRKTSVTIDKTDVWNPDLDLHNLFEFGDNIIEQIVDIDKTNDTNWYQLHQYRQPTQSLISDSHNFRSITDKNYNHYVTSKGWHTLTGVDGGTVNVISVLNPEVLNFWHSVYIASANFFYSKMGNWFLHYKFQYYTPDEYVFNKHTGNIILHTSHDSKFTWSNTKRQNYPDILQKYHEYVKSVTNTKIITIRNNNELSNLGDIEKNVKHNVHGLNDLDSYCNISLESALIPDNIIKNFIIDNWLTHLSKYEQKHMITHMFSAYLFYQVIMRTKLRSKDYSGEQINIFVLDQDTGVCLLEYFEIAKACEMDITSHINWKTIGRPIKYLSDEDKKQAKSETNKRTYEKRKNSVNKSL